MLARIRIRKEDTNTTLYKKELYNKAISLVEKNGELDPFDGSVELEWDKPTGIREFSSISEAVQFVALQLNRRGAKDTKIPYMDWLFHNKLKVTHWGDL